MKFYSLEDGDAVTWHGTLGRAHAEAKKVPPVFRGALRIAEVDIATGKAGVLDLLTGGPPHVRGRGRVWKVRSRGGLQLVTE